MRKLNKTTIIIWSDPEDLDPSRFELSDLAYEAEEGSAYCSLYSTEVVEAPEKDALWDGTEFFDDEFEPPEPAEEK